MYLFIYIYSSFLSLANCFAKSGIVVSKTFFTIKYNIDINSTIIEPKYIFSISNILVDISEGKGLPVIYPTIKQIITPVNKMKNKPNWQAKKEITAFNNQSLCLRLVSSFFVISLGIASAIVLLLVSSTI